ncbi:Uncharacterized protein AB751O23_BC_00030 [Chlamydiales bacterium SCGC AB-751-O23]|jgi:cell shape-determining protein MreD|nr:Uncharacterized protein AB751O23_BC_00030 [Chlamydiales bacterium SCGC AB-751-O23]
MIWKSFLAGLFLSLILPSVTSLGKIAFFIPAIVASIYQKSLSFSLCLAFLSGFLMDTITSDYDHLGLYTMNYLLITYFIQKRKNFIASDSWITLPLTACVFSFLSTLTGMILVSFFESKSFPAINLKWFFTDFVLMSLLDGFYTFLILLLPGYLKLLFPRRKKRFSLNRPY